jgi:hydrogenase-4 component B
MVSGMSEPLVLLGILIAAASGVPGLLLSRKSATGQWVTTWLAVLGAALGLGGIAIFWITGNSQAIILPWSLPGAEFRVAVDGLSAVFLLPIFLISLLGNIYGLGYWKQTDHPQNARKLRLFYGTVTAGMGLLVIAHNSLLFLVGWEIMALSAFFLVTTEDHEEEVRRAGWVYLVATHVGTLCLFGLFALLRGASGSFDLAPLAEAALTPGLETAIFVLALLGFGLKAGVMPLHVWLPSAHAMAPSHVSALMSGVLIKMGIYGFLRITSLVPHPPVAWGGIVLALGAVSGVLGLAFAAAQQDLKRLLAYCSIENIGLIFLGLGLALLGQSLERSDWVVLGLAGALLHVLNHALFKSLLFLSAGSVIHATGTRAIDQLGGLAKAMPRTAFCFLIGAVAICGLPPLNGFISEFLLYLGLFGTLDNGGSSFAGAALAAPALALIGALAVACFVKVYGLVFLGTARSRRAEQAHESPPSMLASMAVLVAGCALVGLAPLLVAPILGQGIAAWSPDLPDATARLSTLAPLGWLTVMGLVLTTALGLGGLAWRMRLRRTPLQPAPTWGCGYRGPTPRMQYTSSSFAQLVVGLFAWALRPRLQQPRALPLFPSESRFQSEVRDTVLTEGVLPAFRFAAWLFARFRLLQQGNIQAYVLYIFIALITLLLWR